MSEFTEIQTELKDIKAALEILTDQYGTVEEHLKDPQPLYGYKGDDRSKLPVTDENYAPPCHLIVRQQFVGGMSNDIGIERKVDGRLSLWVSGYDKARFSGQDANKLSFLDRFKMNYGEKIVSKTSKLQGYKIAGREVAEDGTVRLRLRRA